MSGEDRALGGHEIRDRVARPARDDLGLILVDYDNLFSRDRRERSPSLVEHDLVSILREVRRRFPAAREFRIRLYGGWYQDGILTDHGSEVAGSVSSGIFPLVDRDRSVIIRGEIELVDELLAVPSVRFRETFRRRGGLPRLRLAAVGSAPDGCAQPNASCPVAALRRFSRKKPSTCPVESCVVTSDDAFVVSEQKMVDALLICDLLHAVELRPAVVAAVTSDTDLLPALVQASVKSSERLVLIGDQSLWPADHLLLLESLGVHLLLRSTS